MTREAFKRVGYEAQFDFEPWARALGDGIAGKYDVVLGAYYTEERAKKFKYSDGTGSVRIMLWKLKSKNIPYHDRLEELKGYAVGMVRNSAVNPEFDSYKENLKIDYASNQENDLKKLIAGNIDLFIEKNISVDTLLNTTYSAHKNEVESFGKPLMVGKFYNMFSMAVPDYEKHAADFNRGLKMIKEDGTENRILAQHGLSPE